MKKKKCRTIGRKVGGLLLTVMTVTMLFSGGISFYSLYALKKLSVESSEELGQTAAKDSETALEALAAEHLRDIAEEKAAYMEEKFGEVEAYVKGIAAQAEDIYDSLEKNPERYPDREVPLPLRGSHALAAQLLWSERLAAGENAPPPAAGELLKLGNLQDMLVQYNANNSMVSSVYLATETGWVIQADYIAYSKYTGEETLPDFYEAASRQWYRLAREAEPGQVVYTGVLADVHSGEDCIVCAVPVYHNGEVVAVAGAGSYLKTIKDTVMDTAVGEQGYAFLLNGEGEIIASGRPEGETAPAGGAGADLRESGNAALAEAAARMTAGETGASKLELNGEEVYLSYAPLRNLGWSFAAVMNAGEVTEPAEESLRGILEQTRRSEAGQETAIRRMLWLFGALFAASALLIGFFGAAFSERVTLPIRMLTEQVNKIDGGNLDCPVRITTGDEVQELGDAFNRMAEQLRNYIANLAAVTAEKERIRAEIQIAARLQADMLPETDGESGKRQEFALAAFMNPAKGVGGDFYDFFLLDEGHLALVIADVAGKGVPAALFMVVARTLIRGILSSGAPLERAVEEINASLCRNNKNEMFVTAWLGILTIDTGELESVNAGHCPPVLTRGDGARGYCTERGGFVLAGNEKSRYESNGRKLEPGDTLFLYTDGVTEAENRQEEFYGEKRLLDTVGRFAGKAPRKLVNGVWKEIEAFQKGREQFDDITMLAMVYHGPITRRKSGRPDIGRLREYADFLTRAVDGEKLSESDVAALQTALDEIYSNICYYSGAGEVSLEVKTKTEGQERYVILIFEDDGIPYDPLEQGEPDVETPLRERKEGGLGIHLVKRLMDKTEYGYEAGKNRLILRKRVTKPVPPADDIPAEQAGAERNGAERRPCCKTRRNTPAGC